MDTHGRPTGRPVPGGAVGERSAELVLDPVPASAGLARRFAADHAGGLTGTALETLVLLTSELVTNGVLHARTPLRLTVTAGAGRVVVALSDDDRHRPRRPLVDQDRPSGRGLLLLDGMARDWGVDSRADGKTVWFTLPAAARAAVAAGSGGGE